MATYLLRRALLMIPTLIGITFLVFMLVALAPGGIGGVLQLGAGGSAQASSGVAAQQAYLEDRYGLSDSVLIQYARWLGRICPVKFGGRDQVLPNGEIISAPRPIPEPPLWEWFAPSLPIPPVTVAVPMPEVSAERLPAYRKVERAYADARFEAIAAVTTLRGALTAYARARGWDDAVAPDGKPILEKLRDRTPAASDPAFTPLREAGLAAMTAFAKADAARAVLIASFNSRPFPSAGVAVIPGAVSLAWPDFGYAFSSSRPVLDVIAEALPVTLTLNIVAIPIIYLIAIPSGMLAAARRGTWMDSGLGMLYIGLYSFPVILGSTLLVGFLANRTEFLGWFPVAKLHSVDAAAMTFLPGSGADGAWQRGWLLDTLWHMTLPVTCLVYTGFAVLSKQTRAAMLENFSADYVRTAKAKGVSPKDVLFRHVFRNSLIPLITIFVTIFPAMLAGSVIVERVFSIPGMGSLVIDAIGFRDRELILSNTTMIAVINLVALLLADVLYALADPRVTYD